MFTGLVDHIGTILQVHAQHIDVQSSFTHLELGESIAVDGICLTVIDIKENSFSCDLSPETKQVTTAQFFKPQKKVNLERALQPLSRLGGHFVLGHVDQISHLESMSKAGAFIEMRFSHGNKNYLMPKGSVAINGVSLTINALTENGFNVMLIPHTLERTNLSVLREGDTVNIEFDMIAKMVVEQCQRYLHQSKMP